MAEISTIARPYAVAVYQLAKEKKALKKWSDMLAFTSALVNDAQMQAFIHDPKVTSAQLEESFLTVCDKNLDKHGQNLIKVLVEYGRVALLPAIAESFETLKAEDEGTLEAEIIAAKKPTVAKTKELVKRLEEKFGKKIDATVSEDPDMIGGFKIIVGDTVIDASVTNQLQNLAYTLSA